MLRCDLRSDEQTSGAQTERRGYVRPVRDLPGAGTHRPLRLFGWESGRYRASVPALAT